jgi:drug/metabolite transporter (DMT)-like permease
MDRGSDIKHNFRCGSIRQEKAMISNLADIFGIITFGWFVIEMVRKLTLWLRKRGAKAPAPRPGVVRSRSDYIRGIIYALICALIWAFSYITLSYVKRRIELFEMNIVLMGFGSIFLLLGSWLASLSPNPEINVFEHKARWVSFAPWIVTASNLASFAFFIYALNFISASQTITLQKMNPVLVAMITWFWLGRKPSRTTLSTVFLVVSGGFLIPNVALAMARQAA